MNALVTTTGSSQAVAHYGQPVAIFNAPLIQPVANVANYLVMRDPVMDCTKEEALLLTLPSNPRVQSKDVRGQVRARCNACLMVLAKVKAGSKVEPACRAILPLFKDLGWHWELKTFRELYDKWVKAKDWIVFVNRSKAGAAWIEREYGQTDAFLDFVAGRCGEFRRTDALPEAIRSIHRQWKTGLNHLGMAEVIPGSLADGCRWEDRNTAIVPNGWTPGNLRKQLEKRAKYLAAHKALMHEGIAAARKYIPQVNSSREGMRFMQEVQFDDVKVDFRVFDSATGQVMDLWLLIAHDRATGMLLGFGMRPARVREDGSQEHLKLRDMKQLVGWLLERYGLPPYLMMFRVERGAATMELGSAQSLQEMLPGRLEVHFTSMIGGKSPSGYLERALGNSKGKASLESHNRVDHLIRAGIPGQTGPHYGVRPADLARREAECVTIWKMFEKFPAGLREELRDRAGYPLLTLQQARKMLLDNFAIRNARTDHNMEGFERILVNEGGVIRERMESPSERASKLCTGIAFDRVSPEIIAAFYEHTQRATVVTDAGEIVFSHEKRKLTFVNPNAATALVPGRKVLAYFHPDDPRFLYLTDGNGAVIGTWLRRALLKAGDRAALSEAIHRSESALKAAKEHTAAINAETPRLEAMRVRNDELLQANTFIDVTPAPAARAQVVESDIASRLVRSPKEMKRSQDDAAALKRAAREALKSVV